MSDGAVRILVTGAAGSLGRWIVDALHTAGHDVHGADRAPAPATVPSGPATGRLPHTVGDLRDPDLLRRLCAGADAVVHCAAIPNPGHAPAVELFVNNTATTYALLTEAAAAGVRHAVLASSLSVLGMSWAPEPFGPAYLPVGLDHPCRPRDPYSLSKVVDETTAASCVDAGMLDVTLLRLPAVLHPHHVADPDRPDATGAARLARELFGYVDVRDAARAFVLAVNARPGGLRTAIVTAADTRSRTPSAELARRHYPEAPVRAPLPGHRTLFDLTPARELLGFSPRHSWREAVPHPAPPPTDPTRTEPPR